MATATFVHQGDSVDYTPSTDVDAGDVVVQGELVGVASLDISSGVKGSLVVEGVIDFPKSTGSSSAITAGANVYWDSGNEVATTTAASWKLIGKTVAAAGDDDETVRVKLNQ